MDKILDKFINFRPDSNEQQSATLLDVLEAPLDLSANVCPVFASTGICTNQCKIRHGIRCHICSYFVISKDDPLQRDLHYQRCFQHAQKIEKLQNECSKDMECCVCFEIVSQKSVNRSFAIRENCSHCMCSECATRWHHGEMKQTCPVCRIISENIVFSKFWFSNQTEKDAIFQNRLKMLNRTYLDVQRAVHPSKPSCKVRTEI
ncbi:hypothetical protein ACOME3_003666 [Neoechinorhynchus agilis]